MNSGLRGSGDVGVVGAITHKRRQLVRVLDAHSDFALTSLTSLTTAGGETGDSYGSVADTGAADLLSASTRELRLSETSPDAIPEAAYQVAPNRCPSFWSQLVHNRGLMSTSSAVPESVSAVSSRRQQDCVAADVSRGSVGTSIQNAELLVKHGYV